MSIARLQVLGDLREGQIVRIRLLIQHAMDTGYLQNISGQNIPRNIIKKITCQADQFEIFRVDPSSGIAANPYFEFSWRVSPAKILRTLWVDDIGVEGELLTPIDVKINS
jgi:sulfur-oxidizing protein SoxZ